MWRLVINLLLLCVLTGCCNLQLWQRKQPKYPGKLRGWVEELNAGRRYIGPFLLRKGEETDNGKLGVKVTSILPATCAAPFAEYPDRAKVVLQFFAPTDHKRLCEVTLAEQSNSSIDRPDMCQGKVDVSVVGVTDINTAENWAVFDLRQ